MACEDFPCCGHELGCCPRFDEATGEQLDMVCTCGARLPVDAPYSICNGCMRSGGEHDYDDGPGPMDREYLDDPDYEAFGPDYDY